LQLGLGTRQVATDRIFTQGDFRQTENPFDLTIAGKGFFQVKLPTGETGYTRDGSLHPSADGLLVTSSGDPLEPQVTLPPNWDSFTIGKDGTVTASVAGVNQAVGAIQLANFPNPAGLNAIGGNLLKVTTASGDAVTGAPGENGTGQIFQGSLENSNVSVVEEMVNMIIAQRAYEVNSRAVKAADDMLSQINNLTR
jgi:flagellar basal-body rod protein FlgG